MTKRFCSQCGTEVPAGSSFCPACGTVQKAAVQQPYPNTVQPSPSQPSYQPVNQPNPQVYQQPYQAGPPTGYSTPRVTSIKATGLIIGVFALIAAFILAILIFILPSKEEFALMASGSQTQASENTAAPQSSNAGEPAALEKYGEPPASVLKKVDVAAEPEDYAGGYTGTAYFKNENLDVMSEVLGDSSYADILSAYNGKTYDCTAETDDCVRVFSPDVYSESDDGSFYTYYYFDLDLENGIALDEESDYDEEMQCRYYIADKAYFLTDGSIYVINVTTAEFDDGRTVNSEIRMELRPNS